MATPTLLVQADFSGTAYGGSPTWTDITAFVLPTNSAIEVSWGRQDEDSDIQPSRCSLTLDNVDGRFTPGNTGLRNNLLGPDVASPGHLTGTYTGNFTTTGPASLFIWNATAGSTGVFTDDNDISALGVNIPNAFGGAPTAIAFMSNGVPVTAGQTYTAAVEINNGTTTAGSYGQLRFLNGSGVDVGDFAGNVIAAGQSGYSKVTATAPAGAVTAVLHTYLNAAQTSGVTKFVYLDNFSIESGAVWSGEHVAPYYPHINIGTRLRVSVTVGGTTYNRFDGYIDEWEAIYGEGNFAYVALTASDILARMGTQQTLRSLVLEEMLLDSPTALYPLDEAEGATSTGDLTGANSPATVVASKNGAGVVTFGNSDAAVLVDSFASLTSPGGPTNAAAPAMSYLLQPNALPSGAGWTDEIFFLAPTAIPAGDEYLVFVPGTAVIPADGLMHYSISSIDGTVNVTINGSAGATLTLFSSASVCDGKWHQAAVSLSADGRTGTLVLDGVVSQSVTAGSSILWVNSFRSIAIGADLTAGGIKHPLNTSVALRAQYSTALSTARLAAHYNAAKTGFAGERTDVHAARLLSYRPNTGSALDTGVGTIGVHSINGVTLQQALVDTAKAEGGVVYVDGQGRVVMLNRSHNYDPSASVTLNASLSQVTADLSFRLDTQLVSNDVTISRPNGASQRKIDGASQVKYGIRAFSDELVVNSDQDASDAAGWTLVSRKTAQVRAPALACDLLGEPSTALVQSLLTVAPLTPISVTNLPAAASPSTSVTLVVQGGSETISVDEWVIAFYTANTPPQTLRCMAAPSSLTKLDAGLVIPW